jgi:acetyl-CoA carboxylase biotin carboxyl carrier protein
MAAKEPRSSSNKLPDTQSLALADIRVLAKILNEFDLSEVEFERGGQRVRLRRARASALPLTAVPLSAAQPTVVVPAAPPPAAPAAPIATVPTETSDGSTTITSPFVGTFYRAPAPDAPPFVNVGQTARKGQVLCIVEAMKLMNEIEAECDCKIVEILGKNGEPVEFGQPLFKVLALA